MAPAKANGVSVGEVACLTPYRLGAVGAALAYRASLRFLIRFLIGFQIHFLIFLFIFSFIFEFCNSFSNFFYSFLNFRIHFPNSLLISYPML